MPKSKTHFPVVPVEIAKKVAEAESKGHLIDALKPNGQLGEEKLVKHGRC
jgi:hypothetical protein